MEHSPKALFAPVVIAVLAAMTAACQSAYGSAPETVAETATVQPPSLVAGLCGDCHAVEPPFLSPNPRAPSFESIANREGITEDTITQWLIDAHNYPELMDFELNRPEAQQVADYMITLRREDYVPEE